MCIACTEMEVGEFILNPRTTSWIALHSKVDYGLDEDARTRT